MSLSLSIALVKLAEVYLETGGVEEARETLRDLREHMELCVKSKAAAKEAERQRKEADRLSEISKQKYVELEEAIRKRDEAKDADRAKRDRFKEAIQ